MSASTGTIRRPMGRGSISAAVAIGAATLVAALGIAWGALNITATKPAPATVTAPVIAPTYIQRYGRGITPQVSPTSLTPTQVKTFVGDSIVSKPDNTTSRITHTTHPRHLAPR